MAIYFIKWCNFAVFVNSARRRMGLRCVTAGLFHCDGLAVSSWQFGCFPMSVGCFPVTVGCFPVTSCFSRNSEAESSRRRGSGAGISDTSRLPKSKYNLFRFTHTAKSAGWTDTLKDLKTFCLKLFQCCRTLKSWMENHGSLSPLLNYTTLKLQIQDFKAEEGNLINLFCCIIYGL